MNSNKKHEKKKELDIEFFDKLKAQNKALKKILKKLKKHKSGDV